MNVARIIEEMKRQNMLDWTDNTSVVIEDNESWVSLIVRNGTKPPLSVAQQIWTEISPILDRQRLDASLLETFKSNSKNSSTAISIFLPIAGVIEKMTVDGHTMAAKSGKSLAQLTFEGLLQEDMDQMPPKYAMENLPNLSAQGDQDWFQSWENFKAQMLPTEVESALPNLSTEDQYRIYVATVGDFLDKWGLKVALSHR